MKRINVFKILVIASICVSGAIQATAAGKTATVALDVNDVSLMLPLKQGKPLPALNLEADQLLSPEIFKDVLLFEKKTEVLEDLPYIDSSTVSVRANWFVTSLRVDPCGEIFDLKEIKDPVNNESILSADRAPGCVARLRMVVQPFNGFGSPIATAVHLLFALDAPTFKALVGSLIHLKSEAQQIYGVKTSGLPLIIHPSLDFEAQKEAKPVLAPLLATAIRRTLTSAGAKLEIVTLIVQVTINHWRFVGGIVENNRWQRFATQFSQQFNDGRDPEMISGMEDISCTVFSVCRLKPFVQQKTLNPTGTVLSEIFQDNELKVIQTPGHRTSEIHKKAEQVDNVAQTHFFNTNCVSCHQSSNLRDREKLNLQQTYWSGLTPFVPKKYMGEFNNSIINFGYFGTIPRISTRTAAESVNVAHSLNQKLGLKEGSGIQNLDQFWKCIVQQDEMKVCLTKR